MILGADRLLLRQGLAVLAIALSWLGIFNLNAWLFSDLEYTIRAHWIFLPAVMRPLAILLFGGAGAWGLVLGAYLTVYGTAGGDYLHEIALSLLSGLLPWLAVNMAKRSLNISSSLTGFRASHIIMLCALCAGINAISLNAYLWVYGLIETDFSQIFIIFIGDLLGAAILLFIISTALAFVFPRSTPL